MNPDEIEQLRMRGGREENELLAERVDREKRTLEELTAIRNCLVNIADVLDSLVGALRDRW